MRFFSRRAESAKSETQAERRSATQIYLDGGGDPADERTMAILAEADRSSNRNAPFDDPTDDPTIGKRPPRVAVDPLHAHEITANDAAMIRAMAGANFGPDATVTLPSGRTITGAEMQRWLEANG